MFQKAVTENVARKNYSDVDRARIVHEYRARSYTNTDIGVLHGLSQRRIQQILSVLSMPLCVQEAIHDQALSFTSTHALMLKAFKEKHASLKFSAWIDRCLVGQLSCRQLKEALLSVFEGRRAALSIIDDDKSDLVKGKIIIKRTVISSLGLNDERKSKIIDQLKQVEAVIESCH